MSSASKPDYPPLALLSDDRLVALHSAIRDWQLTHGSLIKIGNWDDEDNIRARPIGTSIFPTLFPRSRFEEARQLQKDYNELYAAVAEDDTWLAEVLRDMLVSDPFAKALWSVHLKAKEAGYIQPLTMGIFRSDYMLHQQPVSAIDPSPGLAIKQVEFNTMSCAGGTHASIVNTMHHHLTATGLYTTPPTPPNPIHPSALPTTSTISNLVFALATAHAAYGPPKTALATATAILMPVQPFNINICDERPLEYGLWARAPPIPCHRVDFPTDFLARTTRAETGELLFYPPHSTQPVEVSVAYMRAGYDAGEHDEEGMEARVRIETSRAIKCPSVLGQLAGFKKVQQALAGAGVLERFLLSGNKGRVERIRGTFAPMYPLDETEVGLWARGQARRIETAGRYVLKPSLEGGGHNVYRGDIPEFLERAPEAEWRNWVLMEMIEPPKLRNVLLSAVGVHEGGVVSELGIFGTCIWKKRKGGGAEIVENKQAGWSFKTKADSVDEMSVVKGYGCFDTPCLVEDLL
ncbi:glutathione synthase [Mytilinidion resinicola]|uniref:Glutathione synthetase n=1 Tax=Mytilinidion resinicola TaxID=574789 RepID=A0A6A6Z1P7_9PEZI|nr:glutathione synthase [Mytilinidion resinicola]KAF2814728.1 glutathione synthase [Mytilinidion resinicola]